VQNVATLSRTNWDQLYITHLNAVSIIRDSWTKDDDTSTLPKVIPLPLGATFYDNCHSLLTVTVKILYSSTPSAV